MSELATELCSERTMLQTISQKGELKEPVSVIQSKDITEREQFVNKVRKSFAHKDPQLVNEVIVLTEKNLPFQDIIQSIEFKIDSLIDNAIKKNNTPSINPDDYKDPRRIKFSIAVPAIPITPYEKKILLDYLNYEYLEPYWGAKLRGNFNLKYKKRIFFEDQFILTLY